MLTGRPLFTGETVSDVLAAVLTREPDWTALPASTPPGVRRLLRRCLERDPKRRLRDVGEARIALASPLEETAPQSGARADSTIVRQLTFEPGLEADPPFSPDGNYVAYTTNEQGSLDVAVMPLGGGPVRPLVATPADEAQPALSPDGTRVYFP